MGLVFARLIVAGESCGVKPFIVSLSDGEESCACASASAPARDFEGLRRERGRAEGSGAEVAEEVAVARVPGDVRRCACAVAVVVFLCLTKADGGT